MSKRQHNFSPRSYIWAQVSGTHLANSHQGAPTLYLFQFQTHFYILTFTNYWCPNYRHISTFLHSSIIYIPITDIFLHLTLTNYFPPNQTHFYIFTTSNYFCLNSRQIFTLLHLSQFHISRFFIYQLFLPRSRYMSTFLQLFLSQLHTEVYTSQCIFSPIFSVKIISSSRYSYSKRLSALSLIQD